MASVKKRPDGKWRARYRGPDGREHARHFTRKIDAERWLVEQEHTKQHGTWVDPGHGKVTFAEWVARHEVIRRKLRATTEARNACLLACHVLPRFGALPLSAIDHLSVREWVADLTRPKTEGGAGLAPGSVEKVFNVLDKTLQAAVDGRMLGEPR